VRLSLLQSHCCSMILGNCFPTPSAMACRGPAPSMAPLPQPPALPFLCFFSVPSGTVTLNSRPPLFFSTHQHCLWLGLRQHHIIAFLCTFRHHHCFDPCSSGTTFDSDPCGPLQLRHQPSALPLDAPLLRYERFASHPLRLWCLLFIVLLNGFGLVAVPLQCCLLCTFGIRHEYK
jgi:hypothetical protein